MDRGPMDQFAATLDRGWDLVSRGDLAGAMLSAEKTLELDAQSPEAHNLMGYVFAAEGHAEEALDHYRQAIDLDEGFVEAMLNAAELLIHPLGDHEAALKLIDDALDLSEGDDEIADTMLLKFDALVHQGNKEAAARVIAALPDGPFENPSLDFMIGRAKFEIGDVDGAEPRIRRALEQDKENPDAHYYMALVHEARGNMRDATVCFLHARDLDLQMDNPPWTMPADQFEARVQAAIQKLPKELAAALDGSLVVVAEAPGVEVVADGVDPRVTVLLEDLADIKVGAAPRVGRVFVYQRNVERVAVGPGEVEDEVARAIEIELGAAFPALIQKPETPPANH
ncbi:MAG: tetratricopeptide repeat protein [Sandaracinaceae bacterium]|nr:tetratricopeptide repeat protein [Sandaracinaceae bacterium]